MCIEALGRMERGAIASLSNPAQNGLKVLTSGLGHTIGDEVDGAQRLPISDRKADIATAPFLCATAEPFVGILGDKRRWGEGST